MDYTYEFLKIEPKQLFVQIKYSADNRDDQYRNLRTNDFTAEGLDALAVKTAVAVMQTWDAIESAPDTVVLPDPVTTTYVPPVVKEFVPTNPPSYDEFTQRIEETATETDTQIIQGWNVIDLSASEQTEFLTAWRTNISSTMRQARLALKQQGLLATVQSNIDTLTEDSQIEWEYAAIVERNSPLVTSLGGALGLTETQVDDLFKLAITL